MPSPSLTSYDAVPYPSYTHPQTHPDRLAVIGRLYGLDVTPTDRCRVLELGGGDGSNLIPMAWALPRSEFVAVDLAATAIARGQRMAGDLGLKNVRLIAASITELPPDLGKFDYIIAHGVYSWVPQAVQEGLLTACRQLLAPQGIAFVSYNALPGCHARNMVREMLLFHVRGFRDPGERVNQALALSRFLARGQGADTRDEYRIWMKAEFESVLEHDRGHLFHDELAELNEPLYFTQFIDRIRRHDLQYLGEADYFEMHDHGFTEESRQTLSQLANDRILREQYLDFLKCRRFRQTLLCHREAGLRQDPNPEPVADFFVSSTARCKKGPVDLRPGLAFDYETPKGGKCETDFAVGKATLAELELSWPMPVAFDELFQRAGARLRQAGIQGEDGLDSRKALCGFLLQLYGAGVVEFRASLPPLARGLTERPVASPVVRWQARRGEFVASLFHVPVKVEDEIGRSLLSWLDGTRDRQSLLEELWAFLKSKNALIITNSDESAARHELETNLDKNLTKLARMGLLVD